MGGFSCQNWRDMRGICQDGGLTHRQCGRGPGSGGYGRGRRQWFAQFPLCKVEGFFDCLWLHQCGFPNVVALMGSYLSENQRDLLVASVGPQGKITVLMDNDEAGSIGEAQCMAELCQYVFVKVVRLPVGHNQPDNLTESQVHQLLTGD